MRGGIAVQAAGVSELGRRSRIRSLRFCFSGKTPPPGGTPTVRPGFVSKMRTENLQLFVQRRLPWVIGAVMLVVYLATMGRWLTMAGAPNYARVLGWDWQPVLFAPLYHALTYPVRLLPADWQVVALNIFSAVCAAATAGLLARSVSILPYDRTRDERSLEQNEHSFLTIRASWIPPLLAALVCGLQLTFWEHSVTASTETLDLLIFAWIIRELLEYRLEGKNSRLYRTALIYGLGMTNNFAMIGFFPAFVLALMWIKGGSFFNKRFLVRMTLLGLAGLSFYLLLPIVYLASGTEQSFWELLKVNIGSQKTALLGFRRFLLILLGMTSLFPVFFMGIKWPANFGDISAVGNALTNIMTHVIHGVFLVACLYVAFDPAFSPRALTGPAGYPLLSFYYLGALSIGYFAGYFLLVFSPRVAKAWQRPSVLRVALNYAVRGGLVLAVAAVPAGLVWKNLPKLRTEQGPEFSQFGSLAAGSLPPQGAAVLSDDPFRLFALEAALNKRGNRSQYVLVDTASLAQPQYHTHMRKRYGERWPSLPILPSYAMQVDPELIIRFVAQLSQRAELYYLHPSFGYYFEHFYLRPQNLVYRMVPMGVRPIAAPLCSAAELKENDAFWRTIKTTELAGVLAAVKTHTNVTPNVPVLRLAMNYSRGLNYMGVEFQRAGDLDKAAEYFNMALEFNPDSPSAFINLDYNKLLKEGKRESREPSEGAVRRLSIYGWNWDGILNLAGPFDEPTALFVLAKHFAAGRNFRQAAQFLSRSIELAPEYLEPRLALPGMLVQAGLLDAALETVATTRAFMLSRPTATAEKLALLEAEAWAYARQNDLAKAERILSDAIKDHPLRPSPYATLAEIYRVNGRHNDAIELLDRQLKLQPEAVDALVHAGAMRMELLKFDEAIPLLDRALKLQPQNALALINRAIAQLRSGRLDGAQQDYEILERILPRTPHAVYYGLGEIAAQKKRYKEAIRYYDQYLKVAPVSAPETDTIRKRLQALRSSAARM
jgi:tetratricopeptide (TPR) repeat protein